MTSDDINKFRGVVKKELKPINEKLGNLEHTVGNLEHTVGNLEHTVGNLEHTVGNLEHKLDTLWDQTVKLTEDMTEVQDTLDSHTTALKQIAANTEHNRDNTVKLDKRVHELEGQAGIVPPPELTII